jgi:hypothetical protein
MSTGTLTLMSHEREIRDALREGKFQLWDFSAYQDDESLFTAKIQEGIRASIPSPFSPEGYKAKKKRRGNTSSVVF